MIWSFLLSNQVKNTDDQDDDYYDDESNDYRLFTYDLKLNSKLHVSGCNKTLHYIFLER